MIKGKNINLRLVEVEDAQFILSLRLDEDISKYISSVDGSLESQTHWLKQYKEREQEKSEYYFIIEDKDHNRLGTIRIYDIKGDSFCWGSWILSKNAPVYAAIESALLLYDYAFLSLGYRSSHFDVRKENAGVVSFHKRFGAVIIASDELNHYFNFHKEQYVETRKKYKKYLIEAANQ